MKKIYNTIKSATLFVAVMCLTTSCNDWLTIYPQDKVVEDQFWQDKNDLEGVRYAAYNSMLRTMNKFYLWGDLRADIYLLNPQEPSRTEDRETRLRYQKVIQAMPDSSMTEFDWGGVYRTINFCNKVIARGPEVLERDKQFTSTEWVQMKAEMVGLRALNYFYLLRAFKDIPYSTKVINNDSEVEYVGLTNQLAVLDSCIVDLEGNTSRFDPEHPGVLGKARTRFAKLADSKGMITNSALYVMLADMYLWRASLWQGRSNEKTENAQQKTKNYLVIGEDSIEHTPESDYIAAAKYADMALASLKAQNDEEFKNFGSSSSLIEDYGLSNYGFYNAELLDNDFPVPAAFNSMLSNIMEFPVFDDLYRFGNSRESIFELQVSSSDGTENNIVNNLFTKSANNQLSVNDDAIKEAFGNNEKFKNMDTRVLTGAFNRLSIKENTGGFAPANQPSAGYYCVKFARPEVLIKDEGGDKEVTVGYHSNNRNNYIIYRMSDALLIKAEAVAALKSKGELNNVKVDKLCNALRRRAYMPYLRDAAQLSTSLDKVETYDASKLAPTGTSDIDLVMNERMLEFVGEGKRWFDLVRYAERNGNLQNFGNFKFNGIDGYDERENTEEHTVRDGSRGVSYMIQKYFKNSNSESTLINRMKNRYGLYCPIYEMEVKASNGTVQQNPVWNKSKYDR